MHHKESVVEELSLNPQSPVPLYHQIAELLRHWIATGRLAPGEGLPAVRLLARQAGVNMHTVRRAYHELAQQGLVELRGPRGTRVAPFPPADPAAVLPDRLVGFLGRIIREARGVHGLTQQDLARHVLEFMPATAKARQVVHVVECSATQSDDLAEQAMREWSITARGWSLERRGEPPAGPILATYFHGSDIRRRWAHRTADIHLVTIRPDANLVGLVHTRAGAGTRTRIIVCELDERKAANVAADLLPLFPPDRFQIDIRVVKRARDALAERPRGAVLLMAPRVWGALSPEERRAARVHQARYVMDPIDLQGVARRLGWRSRKGPP
jgi:GntR family transcriptional regulator